MEVRGRRRLAERWDTFSVIPLLVLSLVFLAAYATPIIEPNLDPWLRTICDVVQTVIWVIFVVDLLGRFLLADSKRAFLKSSVIEIVAVVVPFFRPLRVLRVLSVGTIAMRRFAGRLRNRVTFYVVGVTIILWFVTGLAVTEAERGAEGSNIANVWQGWWWSFITLATVGYGDKFPVTPEGQWIAVVIVLTGIALLGTISATLASWFVENLKENEAKALQSEQETNGLVRELLVEVQELRKENKALSRRIDSLRKQ